MADVLQANEVPLTDEVLALAHAKVIDVRTSQSASPYYAEVLVEISPNLAVAVRAALDVAINWELRAAAAREMLTSPALKTLPVEVRGAFLDGSVTMETCARELREALSALRPPVV